MPQVKGHATTLRRALVDRAQLGRELLAGLEPALGAARGRGLQIEIQVVGDPGLPSREAAQATVDAVDAVLRAWHEDYVSLRRYLIDEDMLTRENGLYWRSGGPVEI